MMDHHKKASYNNKKDQQDQDKLLIEDQQDQDEGEISMAEQDSLLLEIIKDDEESDIATQTIIELKSFLEGIKKKRESLDKFNTFAMNTLLSLKNQRVQNNTTAPALWTPSLVQQQPDIKVAEIMPIGLASDLMKLHGRLNTAIRKLNNN